MSQLAKECALCISLPLLLFLSLIPVFPLAHALSSPSRAFYSLLRALSSFPSLYPITCSWTLFRVSMAIRTVGQDDVGKERLQGLHVVSVIVSLSAFEE